MALYPVPLFYSTLVAAVTFLTMFFFGTIKYYVRSKTKAIPYPLILSNLFYGISNFLVAFSYLFYNEALHRLNYSFNIAGGITLVFWIEAIFTEKPRAVVILPLSVLSGMAFLSSWLPGTIRIIHVSGMPMLQWTGVWETMGMTWGWTFIGYLCIVFIIVAVRIPRRRGVILLNTIMLLASTFIADAIEQGTKPHVDTIHAAIITFLYVLRGIFASSVAMFQFALIVKCPDLMYTLPFKAMGLYVLHTDGGILLFSHAFSRPSKEHQTSDDLFSGMIQGIRLILAETVGKGNLREIHLDDAVLIIDNDMANHVATVIVSTKAASYLKQQIKAFSRSFVAAFKDHLATPHESSAFDGATGLVGQHFKFLPSND